VFSGAAVGTNLLGAGGTQVAVGALNGCVLIYELANLNQAPVCIDAGGGPIQATPLLTDLDGDGYQDLVTANAGSGWVLAFKGGPGGLARQPFFAQNTTVNPRGPGEFSTPAVGDLDGDGQAEIVATSWNHSVFAWHINGSLVPGFPRFMYDSLWSSPALKDLDGDGRPEIIFGGDMDNYPGAPYPWGGMLWVLRGNGTDFPGFPRNIPRQVVWSSPAVGDVDANGSPDIVFGTGLFFPDSGHHVYALSAGGFALGGWYAGNTPGIDLGSMVMASPALGNLVNGDPRLYTAVVTGDGFTVVLNPDGTKRWTSCDDWTGSCPHTNSHHGSASIADVNGDGQQDVISFADNKLRVFNGNNGALEAQDTAIDPCCQIRTFAPAAAPTISRVGSDTWIVVHGIYDANSNGARDSGDRDRVLAWKIASVPQGRFDWPGFKQNQRRTGSVLDTTAPTAAFSPVPSGTSGSTKVDVSWTATDPAVGGEAATGVRAFDVDVADGAGPFVRWINGGAPGASSGSTATGGAPLYGIAGHTYSLRVRARDGAGNTSDWSSTASVAISGGAPRAQPFASAYAIAHTGDPAAIASPPVAGPIWSSSLARGLAVTPGGGWIADAWGGVHPFGTAPAVSTTGYWPGWDIVRGFAMNADGSGYVLDAYGGLHPVNGAKDGVTGGYWPGWDITRGIVMLPTSTKNAPAGYVLDAWGGVHPFGSAPAVTITGYWPGWTIVRGIAIDPDGPGGYTLDGFGGLHPFGGAAAVPSASYWPGWDIARGAALTKGTPGPAGYVLDGFGGVHPFGGAPAVPTTRYWGVDIARTIAIAP
jgi:hypothetical protein